MKYFSSLDLASGYWQIELDSAACEKSAFTTYDRLYQFVSMPFGLCKAPATFQRVIQSAMAGLEWKSCFIYLDDVLIALKTFREHLTHLREVFSRFCEEEVDFLGHVVSADGVCPNTAKTEWRSSY